MLDKLKFESILDKVTEQLTIESTNMKFVNSKEFELRVRELMNIEGKGLLAIDFNPHPHIFPDICIGRYGVEIKFTENDTWRSVANSILESSKDENVKYIYVIFGKMGDIPQVKWGIYEKCVIHVRTSHVPRFEIDMNSTQSLFDKIGIEYNNFTKLALEDKMHHIRKYARGRLKQGERLWWIEESEE